MFCKTYSAGLLGIEGFVVEVETDISRGIPHCSLVGLPDSAVKESKERVRSAILNSGFNFPLGRLTVNLAPAHLRKAGGAFDLSVATGILEASSQVKLPHLEDTLFIGELSLDGRIKPVHGILPMALAAKRRGIKNIVVPEEVNWEAALSGLSIFPLQHLKDLPYVFSKPPTTKNPLHPNDASLRINPQTVIGHHRAKRAIEIAAAGFHNILIIGPPGTGKTMLASSIPFILPPLSPSERLENISIQSASGNNINESPLPSFVRPFRAPHHSITAMGLIGGGNSLMPGEITLAHNGVLYLDEMSEFPRYQLELLRQPIEERKITLARGSHHTIFPARFMLVGSMNPCPCGYHGFDTKIHQCTCNSASLEKFRKKISGPILDRFDLQLELPRIETFDFLDHSEQPANEDSSSVSRRVLKAVQQQELRFNNTSRRNADMTPAEIKQFCRLNKGCKALLRESYERFDMSHRMYHRIIKLARTISDLNEREMISETDLLEAIYFRTMEKIFS